MDKQVDLGDSCYATFDGNMVIINDRFCFPIILSLRQIRMLCDFVRDETRLRGEE